MTAPKAPEAKASLPELYGQSWYVKCPHCYAPTRYPCVRMYRVANGEVLGFVRKPHAARFRAASAPGAKGGRRV